MGGMGDMGGSFNPDSVQPFPSSHFQPDEAEAEANFSNSDCYDDGSKEPLAIPTHQAAQSNFSISFTNGKFGEDLLVSSNHSISGRVNFRNIRSNRNNWNDPKSCMYTLP